MDSRQFMHKIFSDIKKYDRKQFSKDGGNPDEYDLTNERFNRREKVSHKYYEEFRRRMSDIDDEEFLSRFWATANACICLGGYKLIDTNYGVTTAVAIWMLDQLKLNGNLEYAIELIDKIEVVDYNVKLIEHPEYNLLLIKDLVYILLNRNGEMEGRKNVRDDDMESTIVSDLAFKKGYGEKKNPEREILDELLSLIDKEDIEKAVATYEKDVWKVYTAVGHAMCIADKQLGEEEDKLERLTKAHDDEVMNNLGTDFTRIRMIMDEIHTREEKCDQLEVILDYSTYATLGLRNVKMRNSKKILPKDLIEEITNFYIADPYESAFALFYLLYTNSDIPWLYYGSVVVGNYIAIQLPFIMHPAEVDFSIPDDIKEDLYIPEYVKLTDDNMTISTELNMQQILYGSTGCLIPRIGISSPLLEEKLEQMDIDEKTKRLYRLLASVLKVSADKSASTFMYALYSLDDIDIEEADQDDGFDINELQNRIHKSESDRKQLKIIIDEEKKKNKVLEKELSTAEEENIRLKKEIADLREIVFKADSVEEENEEETEFTFPYRTDKKIISFGGHPSWINHMKEMLPDVQFIIAETTPNTEMIKRADQVWVQTKFISHSGFYKIASTVSKAGGELRYYKYAGAKNCACQIIESLEE